MTRNRRLTAAAVSAALLAGGSIVGAEAGASDAPAAAVQRPNVVVDRSARTSAVPAVASGQAGVVDSSLAPMARRVNRVALRTVAPCVFRRQATRCVINVRRLERRRNRVVAIGTIKPRNGPRIPFQRRVIGVRTTDGFVDVNGLQQAPSCAILNLVLGPLHLDVLGLVIDLNRVVLNIVGQTGAGRLLGNLLCALTGILDNGFILRRFLSVVDELLAAINAALRL